MVSLYKSPIVLGVGMMLLLAAIVPTRADVVLMHNGSLVEGETRQENGAVFVSGPGSEIRLREADVATVVRSPEEAYTWLRNQRDTNNRTAGDCLRLAEWCLRQGMWTEASQELADARRLAPRSERVALIERRLKLLTQPPVHQSPAHQSPAHQSPVHQSPVQGSAVQLASAEEPLAEEPLQVPKDIPQEETLILPRKGLEYFTRRIQPLLVNNCTTSGCHACTGEGRFELDRRLLHGYANARSTQHNLRSILAAIDTENPSESPLLTAARGPHHQVMPFQGNRRDEWLARIEAWITAVAAAQPQVMTEPVPIESAVVQASHEQPVDETVTETIQTSDAKLRAAKLTVGGALTAARPRDEFDPEIFNRKYRRPEDDLPLEPAGL